MESTLPIQLTQIQPPIVLVPLTFSPSENQQATPDFLEKVIHKHGVRWRGFNGKALLSLYLYEELRKLSIDNSTRLATWGVLTAFFSLLSHEGHIAQSSDIEEYKKGVEECLSEYQGQEDVAAFLRDIDEFMCFVMSEACRHERLAADSIGAADILAISALNKLCQLQIVYTKAAFDQTELEFKQDDSRKEMQQAFELLESDHMRLEGFFVALLKQQGEDSLSLINEIHEIHSEFQLAFPTLKRLQQIVQIVFKRIAPNVESKLLAKQLDLLEQLLLSYQHLTLPFQAFHPAFLHPALFFGPSSAHFWRLRQGIVLHSIVPETGLLSPLIKLQYVSSQMCWKMISKDGSHHQWELFFRFQQAREKIVKNVDGGKEGVAELVNAIEELLKSYRSSLDPEVVPLWKSLVALKSEINTWPVIMACLSRNSLSDSSLEGGMSVEDVYRARNWCFELSGALDELHHRKYRIDHSDKDVSEKKSYLNEQIALLDALGESIDLIFSKSTVSHEECQNIAKLIHDDFLKLQNALVILNALEQKIESCTQSRQTEGKNTTKTFSTERVKNAYFFISAFTMEMRCFVEYFRDALSSEKLTPLIQQPRKQRSGAGKVHLWQTVMEKVTLNQKLTCDLFLWEDVMWRHVHACLAIVEKHLESSEKTEEGMKISKRFLSLFALLSREIEKNQPTEQPEALCEEIFEISLVLRKLQQNAGKDQEFFSALQDLQRFVESLFVVSNREDLGKKHLVSEQTLQHAFGIADRQCIQQLCEIAHGYVNDLEKACKALGRPLKANNAQRALSLQLLPQRVNVLFTTPSLTLLTWLHKDLSDLQQISKEVFKELKLLSLLEKFKKEPLRGLLEEADKINEAIAYGLKPIFQLQRLDLLHLTCKNVKEAMPIIAAVAEVKKFTSVQWKGFDTFDRFCLMTHDLWKSFMNPAILSSEQLLAYASLVATLQRLRQHHADEKAFFDFMPIKNSLLSAHRQLTVLSASYPGIEISLTHLKTFGLLANHIEWTWPSLIQGGWDSKVLSHKDGLIQLENICKRHQFHFTAVLPELLSQMREDCRTTLLLNDSMNKKIKKDFSEDTKEIIVECKKIVIMFIKIEKEIMALSTNDQAINKHLEDTKNTIKEWQQNYSTQYWRKYFQHLENWPGYEQFTSSISAHVDRMAAICNDAYVTIDLLLDLPQEFWVEKAKQYKAFLQEVKVEESASVTQGKKKEAVTSVKKPRKTRRKSTQIPEQEELSQAESSSFNDHPSDANKAVSDSLLPNMPTMPPESISEIIVSPVKETKEIMKIEDFLIEGLEILETELMKMRNREVIGVRDADKRKLRVQSAIETFIENQLGTIRESIVDRTRALEGANISAYCLTGLEKWGYGVEALLEAVMWRHPMYSGGVEVDHDRISKLGSEHSYQKALQVLQEYAQLEGRSLESFLEIAPSLHEQLEKNGVIHTAPRYLHKKLRDNELVRLHDTLFKYLKGAFELQNIAWKINAKINKEGKPENIHEWTFLLSNQQKISWASFREKCTRQVEEADQLYNMLLTTSQILVRYGLE